MRRRLLIGILCVLTGALAASPALAKPAAEKAESDVELVNGTGRVVVAIRGALIGSLASGRVTVKDLPGPVDTEIQVLGSDTRFEVDDATTIYAGENLRFRVFRGKWRVTIQGEGIFTSAVGVGSLRLQGTGRLSVAGEPYRPWPAEWTTIKLGD